MSPMLLAVFGVFQIILILMHAATYQSLAAAFNLHYPWLAWLFAILSLTFVSSSIFAHRSCNPIVKWYYRFSMYWFGLNLFLTEATFILFFLEYGLYHNNIYVSPATLATICFGGLFLIHSYATWNTSRVKVTSIEVDSPSHGSWPEFWRGKTIVFVSDVHLGAARGIGLSQKVVSKIQEQSPEVVLIGGDIFDGVKCHGRELLEPWKSLKPAQGVYFASGNHEYIEDTESMIASIKSADIRILNNEVVDLKGIQLLGVDWKDTRHKKEFNESLSAIKFDRSKPSILLRHEPNHLEIAEEAGVSLILCGHTHRGQIFPLQIITSSIYKGFDYGLKKFKNMFVYTSSGVGTWGPPLRFLTKTEIVVIKLK